jgi:hypothetical protein
MALLKWLIVAAAAFGGLTALMYVAQRADVFPGATAYTAAWLAYRKPRRSRSIPKTARG